MHPDIASILQIDALNPLGADLGAQISYFQELDAQEQALGEGMEFRQKVAISCDLFDPGISHGLRSRVLHLVASTRALDWIVVTEHADKCASLIEMARCIRQRGSTLPHGDLDNLWLGASVGSQGDVDRSVGSLLAAPVLMRFVYVRPGSGPIDLSRVPNLAGLGKGMARLDALRAYEWQITSHDCVDTGAIERKIDWLIIGLPHNAPPAQSYWARQLLQSAGSAYVAVHQFREGMDLPKPAWPVSVLEPCFC